MNHQNTTLFIHMLPSRKKRIVENLKNSKDTLINQLINYNLFGKPSHISISEEKIAQNFKNNKKNAFHSLVTFGGGFGKWFAKKHLDTNDKVNLSKSCPSLYGFYKEELTKKATEKLVQHVVRGEQEQAEKMIAANPALLLVRSKAKDYSGRTIHGTAFQAALGAEDERMWEMMMPYFENLPEGVALKQFNQQFPDGIEDTPSKKLQPFYNDLANAIINDEDNGLGAIEAFRIAITQNNHIAKGTHFNMQHLLAAYLAYIDNFVRLATLSNRDIFWQRVIGYVQRQMPANYAQAHCSGLKDVIDNGYGFNRTFRFLRWGEFFPLLGDSGLGFDFGCYSFGRLNSFLWLHAHLADARFTSEALDELYREKQTSLMVLDESLNTQSQLSGSLIV
jgi:hypothetical protein